MWIMVMGCDLPTPRMRLPSWQIWVLNQKIRGFKTPKMDGEFFMENPMYKWMILGYHYFWKHPYRGLFPGCSLKMVRSRHPSGDD